MYTDAQRGELTALIAEQFAKLGEQLSQPMQPGDSAFVTHSLPPWLGQNMELRFNVLSRSGDGRFLLRMDVDFGRYHREMELISGTPPTLHDFATNNPPSRQVCDAIMELMAMERANA